MHLSVPKRIQPTFYQARLMKGRPLIVNPIVKLQLNAYKVGAHKGALR